MIESSYSLFSISPMTPEQEKALTEHLSAIAEILKSDILLSELTSLEKIETTVREKVLTHVSPQLGFFLSKKSQERYQENAEL